MWSSICFCGGWRGVGRVAPSRSTDYRLHQKCNYQKKLLKDTARDFHNIFESAENHNRCRLQMCTAGRLMPGIDLVWNLDCCRRHGFGTNAFHCWSYERFFCARTVPFRRVCFGVLVFAEFESTFQQNRLTCDQAFATLQISTKVPRSLQQFL